jgi:hypothetical protein
MMYLLDQLPAHGTYREYDKAALQFIQMVIKQLPESHPGFNYDLKKSAFLDTSSGRSPFGFLAGPQTLSRA